MKRKILSFLLILTLIVSATPLTGIDFTGIISPRAAAAQTAEIYTQGDYEYIIININEVELRNYLGDETEVVIPSEMGGMPVTSIGEFCFNGRYSVDGTYDLPHPNADNNNKIRKVTVPSSVKTICVEAFSFMESLNEVVLNEGLELIDEFAFANCPKLTQLNLPDSLVTFDFTAVDETPVTELVFGPNVKSVDISTFEYSYLKKIVFNADVITIEKITLDSGRNCLEEIVCNGCLELGGSFEIKYDTADKIICNGDVPYYIILQMIRNKMVCYFNLDGSVVFSKEEILLPGEHESNGFRYFLNEESEAIISRYTGGESVVVVPKALDGYPVTEIGRFAFSSFCSNYYTINYSSDKLIPKDLITSITLPETIEVISEYAFAGNLKLAQINIPSKVTTIPYECFDSCESLEYVEIPESVNKIEARAFYSCEKLKSISLSEGVTEICENTFRGCNALESVDMSGVKKIGEDAFCYCEKLVITELPEHLTELGEGAFYRCETIERLDLTNVTKIGADAMGECRGLKEVILNDNLEHLEYGVFQDCESLESIKLPSKLISIGSCCFRFSGLKEIIFNEGLKMIDGWAFASCYNLSKVVFPESLEYIWNVAFYRCNELEEITIPVNMKILGYHAFSRCAKLTTVYFNATNCKVSNSTQDEAYIPEDWTSASPFYATKITNIVFGENITAISSDSEVYGTFENCDTLQSVTIPDTVEEIGTAAFKNCISLETAVIPDSVTEIADDAFEGCESLTIYCLDTSYACAYAKANGIKVSTFIIEKIPNQTYTGSKIEPVLSVSLSSGKLTENTDFTVRYSNNVNVGEAKVRVTGLGDYSMFTSSASFTIVTRGNYSANVSSLSAQNYTGKPVTPELTITFNGKMLEEGEDYKLTYKNNQKIGTATVYIAGIGNFSGTKTVTFEIEELSPTQIFINSLRDFFNSILASLTSIFAF